MSETTNTSTATPETASTAAPIAATPTPTPIDTIAADVPAGVTPPAAPAQPSPAAAAKPDPYPKDGGAIMRDRSEPPDEVFVFAGSVHNDGKGRVCDGVDDKLGLGWTMVEDRRAKPAAK